MFSKELEGKNVRGWESLKVFNVYDPPWWVTPPTLMGRPPREFFQKLSTLALVKRNVYFTELKSRVNGKMGGWKEG